MAREKTKKQNMGMWASWRHGGDTSFMFDNVTVMVIDWVITAKRNQSIMIEKIYYRCVFENLTIVLWRWRISCTNSQHKYVIVFGKQANWIGWSNRTLAQHHHQISRVIWQRDWRSRNKGTFIEHHDHRTVLACQQSWGWRCKSTRTQHHHHSAQLVQ